MSLPVVFSCFEMTTCNDASLSGALAPSCFRPSRRESKTSFLLAEYLSADLSLALWRYGENAATQIDKNLREFSSMSVQTSSAASDVETYDVVVVGAGFGGM